MRSAGIWLFILGVGAFIPPSEGGRIGKPPLAAIPQWALDMDVGERINQTTNTMQSVDPQNMAYNPNGAGNPAPWRGNSGLGASMWWSGAAFAPNLGKYGTLLKPTSGHSGYWGNEMYADDLETRLVSTLTLPHYPLYNVDNFHALVYHVGNNLANTGELYADAEGTTTVAGQPGAYQSYDGIVVLPPGVGGAGSKGMFLSLIRQAMGPGSGSAFWTHALDLADPGAGWSVYSANNTGVVAAAGTTAALSLARNKVYLGRSGGTFFSALDLTTKLWSILNITGAEAGVGDFAKLMCWDAQDLLLSLRVGNAADNQAVELLVTNLDTNVASAVSFTGDTLPTHGAAYWDDEYEQIFYFSFKDPNKMYRITPPASNPASNSWAVSSEAITGVAATDSGTLSHYSRLQRATTIPGRLIFLWWGSWNEPVQAIRLQG